MSIFKKPEKCFLAKLFKHKQVEELAEELAHTYADEMQEELQSESGEPTTAEDTAAEPVPMLEVTESGEVDFTEPPETTEGESPPQDTADSTEPKQTVIAPTTPKQSAEPETITETSETAKRKAAAEQVERFFAARRARRQAQLDMLNATATKPTEPKPEPSAPTPQPTPTESKAPEKKEDPWKAIRGMGRADEIIADLEAGGVMSFSELSGFFFNTPHSDDHTTELADLKKKFTAIDTLIAKMKHRDELEPVYQEYQGKSGWSQSRFKKKNAATIEDYEQTVKYLNSAN